MLCDARQRESGKEVLIALVEHAMRMRLGTTSSPGSVEPPAERTGTR